MPSIGLDFRGSSPFVSDPPGHFFVQGDFWAPNWPITLGTVNTGWYVNPGVEAQNESAAVDARLAGYHEPKDASYVCDFRVDWTPGVINFRMASGNPVWPTGDHYIQLLDGATNLGLIINIGMISAGHFIDAAGVDHASAAAWVANNSPIQVTLPTGVFYIRTGRGPSATGKSSINHIYIEDVASPKSPPPVNPSRRARRVLMTHF